MRLFAAVLPPQSAVQELADAVRPLHALPQAAPLRWTALPTWHLTLAFLGQVEAEALPELSAGLDAAVAEHSAFELRLAGAGRFGDRALWAGVDGDTRALGRLAESVSAAVRRVGIDLDDRPFQGHLTLARSSTPRSAESARRRPGGPDLAPLADALAGFRGESWQVATVQLMRSHLGAGPSHHERIDGWQLARARA